MSDETMLSGSVKRKQRVWGLASSAVLIGGLAIAGLLGAFSSRDYAEEALSAGERAEPKTVKSTPEVLQTSAMPQPAMESTTTPSAGAMQSTDSYAPEVAAGEPPKPEDPTVKKFLALSDPRNPVALNLIQGVWWTAGDKVTRKDYAFVEDEDFGKPYRAELSLPDGTTMIVECSYSKLFTNPVAWKWGECDRLPLLKWLRVATTNVVNDPAAESWRVVYRAGEETYSPELGFVVRKICYPDGDCTTVEEAGAAALQRRRDKARRGEP